jgi:hypothetical protein
VVGEHRLRKRYLIAGILLGLPSFVVAAALFVGEQRHVNGRTISPTGGSSAKPKPKAAASRLSKRCKTLVRRHAATRPSRSQAQQAVRHALAMQGDRQRPWTSGWAELIELARRRGDVTDEQWQTYVEQAVGDGVTLRLRPRVRAGDPVPYALKVAPLRGGNSVWPDPWVHVLAVELDGRAQDVVDDSPHRPESFSEPCVLPDTALPPGLPTGQHQGHLLVELSFMSGNPGLFPTQPRAYADRIYAATQAADFTVRRSLPFQIVVAPATEPPLEPVSDDRFAADVTAALLGPRGAQLWSTGELTVHLITGPPPPVGLSFRVFARDGTREWPVGYLVCAKDTGAIIQLTALPSPQPPPPRIDIVLRPDAAPAIRTLDVLSAWNREVVLRDVAVGSTRIPLPNMSGSIATTLPAATAPAR